MAFISPSEWSNGVKITVSGVTTIVFILGTYMGVESWADDKITKAEHRAHEERALALAKNQIAHDKMAQSSRLDTSGLNIDITEMKLEQLEEDIDERTDGGKDATARQKRSLERLTKLLETYEGEQADAKTKLTELEK